MRFASPAYFGSGDGADLLLRIFAEKLHFPDSLRCTLLHLDMVELSAEMRETDMGLILSTRARVNVQYLPGLPELPELPELLW